jgi:hypothetical protein
MRKSIFSAAKVKAARKKFAEEKVCGKTTRVKSAELESLLLCNNPPFG